MNKALFSDESRRFAGAAVYIILAGYISNVSPAMMQAFNEIIFFVPST